MNIRRRWVFVIAISIFALLGIGFWFLRPIPMPLEVVPGFRWILPPEYERGTNFYKGRAWVQEKIGGPWTLVDTEGNIIKENFIAGYIMHGLLDSDTSFRSIEKDSETGWDMYGIVDHSGNILFGPQPSQNPMHFQEGMVLIKGENGLFGFVDYQGQWIIPSIYEAKIGLGENMRTLAEERDSLWRYSK